MVLELLLLAVLVVLAYVAYRQWSNQGGGVSAPAPTGPGGIEQVGVGGVIQLPPFGDDLDPRDVEVTARHVYDQDGYRWYELEGQSGSGTVWLDVERDDELETSVTLKRLRLDEIGLAAEAVEQLKPGARVEFDGRVFHLGEQGRARFLPNGDSARAETLVFWDLEGEDDRHDLSIERWDQEYRVYLSQRLSPERIRVYRTSHPE
ncbi:DUF4178 domain-containing protein [Marinobacter xestospongiae]|uniref:DUF4178 domain-containing protein n=1 Tax=Marinobacter xestospongiae TaxID=994319 RepID=UPI002005047F|nr:DUF4178 domain-containing protein [Marinobacter xestospongiae]MCK7567965.1 DUF4178 domain-containing protein [Marinobacter xestospongiae]